MTTEQIDLLQKRVKELEVKAATFKAFHYSLCRRFGYGHDDRDWIRDLLSLEEHIATELQQLRAERDELRRDKERLDWLESHGELEHLYEEGRPEVTVPVIRVATMNFDFEDVTTVRAAIDQAKAALTESQKESDATLGSPAL